MSFNAPDNNVMKGEIKQEEPNNPQAIDTLRERIEAIRPNNPTALASLRAALAAISDLDTSSGLDQLLAIVEGLNQRRHTTKAQDAFRCLFWDIKTACRQKKSLSYIQGRINDIPSSRHPFYGICAKKANPILGFRKVPTSLTQLIRLQEKFSYINNINPVAMEANKWLEALNGLNWEQEESRTCKSIHAFLAQLNPYTPSHFTQFQKFFSGAFEQLETRSSQPSDQKAETEAVIKSRYTAFYLIDQLASVISGIYARGNTVKANDAFAQLLREIETALNYQEDFFTLYTGLYHACTDQASPLSRIFAKKRNSIIDSSKTPDSFVRFLTISNSLLDPESLDVQRDPYLDGQYPNAFDNGRTPPTPLSDAASVMNTADEFKNTRKNDDDTAPVTTIQPSSQPRSRSTSADSAGSTGGVVAPPHTPITTDDLLGPTTPIRHVSNASHDSTDSAVTAPH